MMAANYLHGVETIEVERGPRPVSTVKSAVIGLIGTAPMGAVNVATLVLSEKAGAAFGSALSGFTIPQALDAIYDQGAGTVIVVNVLDPATHVTAVANEAATLDGDSATAAHAAIKDGTLVVKNQAGTTTYVADTDYTVDLQSAKITRKSGGAMAANQALTLAYSYLDPTKVTAADIIGAVNAAGERTGLKALRDTYNDMGFFAKLIIAPGFCTQNSVATEMIATGEALDAFAILDAPIGTTFAQAIAGRGPNGTINFNTSAEHAILCYPHLKVYDTATDTERLEPYSQRLAGVLAARDLERGFWWSPSNTEILGITGVERQLSAMIDDPNSEVNALNEVGIVTVFNSFGTGLRVWGNRSAAWPTVTAMKNFINVRRTGDVINESIRYFSLQFIDQPISQALIDALLESVNAYGRKLIGDGALLGFKAWFDSSRNEQTELAAGHLLVSYKYTPPPPLERLTFETEITSDYLVTLSGGK
jgi:phage tail sheath protein FI